MENFFDFHCHPTLKAELTISGDGKDGWSNIKLDRLKLLSDLLGSQAHFEKLKSSKFKIALVNLHSIERGFAKNLLFEHGIKLFADSSLDDKYLDAIEESRVSYFEVLQQGYDFLMSRNTNDPSKHFNLVQHAADIVPDQLNILLAVEGGHCFEPYKEGNPDTGFEFKRVNDYVANFQNFKNGKRIFSLTLTHLTSSHTCTHASGVRFFGGLAGGKNFKPQGTGLTDVGKALVKECYEPADGQYKVLVDIKHMSMSSREQFYKLREENGWNNIPIVASHMGVNGNNDYIIYGVKKTMWNSGDDHPSVPVRTYAKAGFACKDSQGNPVQTMFNPWTISLYDRDILEILKSKGLIGVSLDRRIMGYGEIFNEFFSKDEFDNYILPKIDEPSEEVTGIQFTVNSRDNNADVSISVQDRSKKLLDLATKTPQIYFLANNILHIIRVGLDNGFNDAWQHVCIGSDLDGMIDPPCKSESFANANKGGVYIADDFDRLATDLRNAMSELIQANGGAARFAIPGNDLDRAVQMIMSENGLNFVSTWLENLESKVAAAVPA